MHPSAFNVHQCYLVHSEIPRLNSRAPGSEGLRSGPRNLHFKACHLLYPRWLQRKWSGNCIWRNGAMTEKNLYCHTLCMVFCYSFVLCCIWSPTKPSAHYRQAGALLVSVPASQFTAQQVAPSWLLENTTSLSTDWAKERHGRGIFSRGVYARNHFGLTFCSWASPFIPNSLILKNTNLQQSWKTKNT